MLRTGLAIMAAVGVAAKPDLDVQVSLKGEHVELSKQSQLAEWIELKDEKYNAKGFTHWKPQTEGFLMKNKDTNILSCHVKAKANDKSAMNIGFDCAVMNKQDGKVVQSAAAAGARFAAVSEKFTPIQEGHNLKPLDPELQYTFEQDAAGAQASHGTWGREVNIDDSVFEGENNNANQDIEQASEKDEREEQRFLDRVDVGPGDLFHEEEAEMQTRNHNFGHVHRTSKGQHLDVPYPKMVDTPYVDAGVDREVNDRMYEFFKKHPQYHTPEAHWRAARKWKSILTQSENKGGHNAAGAGAGNGMWQSNSCKDDQKVPVGWPDVPTMKCRHYAISPMGYWGCQWLFEDGTCGYIQFYPTIRWDGLDSYKTRNHDPEDEDILVNGAFPAAGK